MRHHLNQSRLASRSGFTLVELSAAAGLLGTVFLVTLPLLKHVRTSRDASHQQFIAQQEAANIMERLAIDPSSEAIDESLSVSPEATTHLPDADVSVTRQSTENGLQRVTVTLSWTNEADEPAVPVTLTAWFPVKGAQP